MDQEKIKEYLKKVESSQYVFEDSDGEGFAETDFFVKKSDINLGYDSDTDMHIVDEPVNSVSSENLSNYEYDSDNDENSRKLVESLRNKVNKKN